MLQEPNWPWLFFVSAVIVATMSTNACKQEYSAVAVAFMPDCTGRLTTPIEKPLLLSMRTRMTALYVCAQLKGTGNWTRVSGKLRVENVTGQARLVSAPPPNASMFKDADASIRPIGLGVVRVVATFADMSGGGHLEISEDY